jgi:hypothetical protein
MFVIFATNGFVPLLIQVAHFSQLIFSSLANG